MKKAFMTLMMVALMAACAPAVAVEPSAAPMPATTSAPTVLPTSVITQETEAAMLVAFAKNGDLHLWDSESNQSRIILEAGDVTAVMMSDDGQAIAFLRRVLVEQPELTEYVALWAVDRDGQDPRELVSADILRQHLNPEPRDSAGFAQIGWIPGTHRLVYSGMKFYAPGQGFTNSKDIYVVDADKGTNTVLAPDVMPDTPFINAWSFVISPDGQQIALFSATELSFINVDGSNWRQAVLTYPAVGMGDAILLPQGVWTQDSSAFVFTGPIESDSPFVLNYTIWRVPVDGSPAQSLATIEDSHSNYITFSPDGGRAAFFQDINGDGTMQAEDYRIMPLGVGPLVIPSSFETNIRWSPDGEAFVIKDKDLFRLCPDAVQASEVCGTPIRLGDNNLISSFHWIDGTRFLFLTREPSVLFLGSLDGTTIPIFAWPVEEAVSPKSFTTFKLSQ